MGTQTNLVEFYVQYYQTDDIIFVNKDEEFFEDGFACGFAEGVDCYENAMKLDETYRQQLDSDFHKNERYIVTSPFYVFYPESYMGGDGTIGQQIAPWIELETEYTTIYDVFEEQYYPELIELVKTDFEKKTIKQDTSEDVIELELSDRYKTRSKDQPLSTNMITVWNVNYYHYQSMDGDDFDSDWELLGRLNLGNSIQFVKLKKGAENVES
jgi:hypothetical protein